MTMFGQDEVRAALEPIHELLAKVIELAHREVLAKRHLLAANGFPSDIYPRTGSNSVFDAVARHGMMILGADPRVRVHPESQTVKFSVGGRVVLKFKQADEDNITCNHPTQAVLAFHDPNVPVGMGLPPETAKIEVVWVPNSTRTGYLNLAVVARDQDDVLWEYEIARWAGEKDEGIIKFPKRPSDDSDQDGLVALIAPKKQDGENEGSR